MYVLKVKNKVRILNTVGGKEHVTHKGRPIRIKSEFPMKTI